MAHQHKAHGAKGQGDPEYITGPIGGMMPTHQDTAKTQSKTSKK